MHHDWKRKWKSNNKSNNNIEMNNILTIEEFLQEDYESINEGLLTNLFGAILRKDMWSLVKGENSIKKEFREIDDKLNGFYLTKVKNPNASQNVRQTLVEWAGEIYKAKVEAKEKFEKENEDGEKTFPLEDILGMFAFSTESELKKGGVTDESIKSFRELHKDIDMDARMDENSSLKKMVEQIKKIDERYQKMLDEYTSGSADLRRWAKLLKSNMEIIIDKLLCDKYDEKNRFAEDLKSVKSKRDKKNEEKNSKEVKQQKDELIDLENDRKKSLKDIGAEPNKAYSFADMEKYAKLIGLKDAETDLDNYIPESLKSSDFPKKRKANIDKLIKLVGDVFDINPENEKDYENVIKTLKIITSFFENLDKNFSNVEEFSNPKGFTPQIFTSAIFNFTFYCFSGNDNIFKHENGAAIDMISMCCAYNNVLSGFGLPCPKADEKKDDSEKRSAFGFFVDEFEKIIKKENDKEVLTNFKKIKELILKRANEIFKKNKDENEKEMKEDERKDNNE